MIDVEDYELAGFAAVLRNGQVEAADGTVWPGIAWPVRPLPERYSPALAQYIRDNGWMRLQNEARYIADYRGAAGYNATGARVKVYGYRRPEGWTYTIGHKFTKMAAYRPRGLWRF